MSRWPRVEEPVYKRQAEALVAEIYHDPNQNTLGNYPEKINKEEAPEVLKDVLNFDNDVQRARKLMLILHQVIGIAAIRNGVQTITKRIAIDRDKKMNTYEIAKEHTKTTLSTAAKVLFVHRIGRGIHSEVFSIPCLASNSDIFHNWTQQLVSHDITDYSKARA